MVQQLEQNVFEKQQEQNIIQNIDLFELLMGVSSYIFQTST